jgi:hypothetical protein
VEDKLIPVARVVSGNPDCRGVRVDLGIVRSSVRDNRHLGKGVYIIEWVAVL